MTDTRRSVYSGPAATATCPNCGSVQSGGLTACAKCGAALPVVTASNITPGMIIDGKYEIIGLLGVGGMGEVFKARHIHLNAFRCVKVMKRNLVADESFRNRFLREARVATHVHHANLAVVHDFASLPDGSYYMVSEFVDGITVRQWAGRYGRFGAELAIEIMLQVLSGLEHCHRKGLLHRDISADNIMIEFDDQGHPQAKIIDLGIAKIVSAPASDATQVGLFVGNPKYSSPEQLGHLPDGEEIDGRTDLYSLGVVVYEMLVGVPPFSSKTPHGYVIKHLTQPPIPLREANPTLEWPTGLQEVIFKALEKDRKNRYADAREFAKALRPFGSDQLVHWFPPEGAEPY
ncbi:MAG TPA: protein kinase, partial [Thermoanaerobaculia bacterium]